MRGCVVLVIFVELGSVLVVYVCVEIEVHRVVVLDLWCVFDDDNG